MDHFCCNHNALTPADRAHHKKLTDTLIAKSKKIVETKQGYEFHYRHPDVSVSKLSEWISAESECRPFFDFQIDFQKQAQVLILRLSAAQGVKPFIRVEFGIGRD